MRANLEDNLARRVRHIAARFGSVEVGLSGEYVISDESGAFHFLDGGASARTVRMPPVDPAGGQLYLIVNTGGTQDLNVVDASGVAITPISPGRSTFIVSAPSGWKTATIAETLAPEAAEYIVGSSDPDLTNERVLTDTSTITWDLTVTGIAKANATLTGGNVSNSGVPLPGQVAQWVDQTHITGVDFSTLASALQPLDADLTSLASATDTNRIYYRSAADTWSGITIGANLSFTGGTLSATASGGNVSNDGAPTTSQLAQWTDATHIHGIDISSLGFAPVASPTFTGDPQAPTPLTADNDTSIATTAYVKANLSSYAPLLSPAFSGTPTAPTPTAGDNSAKLATTAFVTTAGSFPSGTLMLFQQTSAPTGWTKQVSHNDKSLRVVSGTASSGGVQAFSVAFGRTAVDDTTLSTAQLASHSHTGVPRSIIGYAGGLDEGQGFVYQNLANATDPTGGNVGHSHGIDIRVQYVDCIIAAKN